MVMKRSCTPKLFTPIALLISTLIFVSCSKNLSRVNHKETVAIHVDSSALAPIPVQVSRPVAIDTVAYAFKNRSSIVNSPYFSQRVAAKLIQFYRGKGFQSQWLFDHAPAAHYYSVINILKNADRYGLVPADYDVRSIEERLNTLYKNTSGFGAEIAELDIHITEMYFLFTTHLVEGKIRNVGNGRNIWKRPGKEINMADVSLLLAAEAPHQLEESLQKLQPANEQYSRLQKALVHYRSLENSAPNNLPILMSGKKIVPMERNSAIPLIRKKLSLTDLKVYSMPFDSTTGLMDSLKYDPVLVDAVRLFQMRHGLEADGIIGDKTLKFMNQSFGEMADVIALNMERMRWLPQDYGDNYILVNIPEYKLRVYQKQNQELEMKVIVGSSQTATPIFSDVLAHIVFSPTWTVPTSIIKGEIIPHLKANPEYYSNKNYTFFKNEMPFDPATENWDSAALNPYQYRVIQNPGPDNSLGLVKFVMPNNMSVYLHDTPNHRLFSKDYRALSHGCVRLADPGRFAEYLLRDQSGWTGERISKAMNNSTPYTIPLKKEYKVHLEYRTAWVDDDGVINFREDIYGHDRKQLTQLLPVVNNSSVLLGME